jgi:hypothetical protein
LSDPRDPGRAKGVLCAGRPGVVGALVDPGFRGEVFPIEDVEGRGCG